MYKFFATSAGNSLGGASVEYSIGSMYGGFSPEPTSLLSSFR
jgi:hypothetical protein